MQNYSISMMVSLLCVFFIISCKDSNSNVTKSEDTQLTVVDYYGQLSIAGSQLVDKNNKPVALRGMSLFWSQWGGKFYNKQCIKWLRDDWKCTVVRASMAVEGGGYLLNPKTEMDKITTVIDACIELGIYVIVDWHDHNAQNHLTEAKEFFDIISKTYGDKPNVIYEVYNEPLNVSWSGVIKPYAEEVINVIRANDSDNIIVVGTPNYSQFVDEAANDPLVGNNLAYALHFYTGTHTQWLRDRAVTSMGKGLALFVTEYGISESNGDGEINIPETNLWSRFLEQHNLSWCNWSIMDKDETSAALLPGANAQGNWNENELSESGRILRDYIRSQNAEVFEMIEDMNK